MKTEKLVNITYVFVTTVFITGLDGGCPGRMTLFAFIRLFNLKMHCGGRRNFQQMGQIIFNTSLTSENYITTCSVA